ncbi:Pentatricopeptide repeat-containing protein [Sesamum alatum]|uniref:Pentatricopeptide repeat-containing protein n=1 Tax=Sesamum alatum TaxID=300844 RepID=A0AAE1YUT9_9LAMI|nr:Pentatricopeptide repeat-containing protein [Sesamum alatum]
MQVRCMQTSHLITIIKNSCKTTSQIHQVHAQAITRGLFSLRPTLLLTQILRFLAFSPSHTADFPSSYAVDYPTKIFSLIPNPSTFNYNAVIRAHVLLCSPRSSLIFFAEMRRNSVSPDFHTFPFVLKACGMLQDSLSLAKTLHSGLLKFGFLVDVFVCNALACTYCRAGDVDGAKKVFERSLFRDVVSYNVMIDGPDGVTILAVLVGCSHSGLIDEARKIFADMESVYGVARELKHYGCMADLLGRAGLIKEATEMIEEMPMGGDVFVWGGLLGGCKIHGNLEVAEEAAKQVMEVKPEDGGVYSLLAHMYANSQRWDDLVKVRRLRDSRWGIKKIAGCSLIELDGITHEFVSGDCLHPHTQEIYFVLKGLELHQYEVL